MITMEDIVREGHPALRKIAKEMSHPITPDERTLAEEMMAFLKNSQDPELSEKLGLRAGV